MKYSFLNSTYDGKTSTVTIGTKWGVFTGSTTRRPEDDEYNSQIFGGELAETRAVIKACRARVKEIKSQQKILKLVDSNFRQISKIKFPNYIYKVIGNIAKNLDMEKSFLESEINAYTNAYVSAIKSRDERVRTK